MEDVRRLREQLIELQTTGLAAPAEAREDEDALVVELAILVCLCSKLFPGIYPGAEALWDGALPAPGLGPVDDHEL